MLSIGWVFTGPLHGCLISYHLLHDHQFSVGSESSGTSEWLGFSVSFIPFEPTILSLRLQIQQSLTPPCSSDPRHGLDYFMASFSKQFETKLQIFKRFYLFRGWRDSSLVRITSFSSRRSESNPHHLHSCSQLSITAIPGHLTATFRPPWATGIHMTHKHTHRKTTHIHKQKYIVKSSFCLYFKKQCLSDVYNKYFTWKFVRVSHMFPVSVEARNGD